MQRLKVAGLDLAHDFSIWKPVRFGASVMGATVATCAGGKQAGFERAAEDPLGARE